MITPKQYAAALYNSLSEASDKEHDKILDRFVGVLRANRALGMAGRIEEEFRRYDNEAKGVRLAEVTSARELTKEEEQKIVSELNRYVAGKAEIKKKVDEGLLGGIVIKLEDEIIDGSLRRRLKELKERLIR